MNFFQKKKKKLCIHYQSTPSKHKSAKLTRLRSSRVGEADKSAKHAEVNATHDAQSCFDHTEGI